VILVKRIRKSWQLVAGNIKNEVLNFEQMNCFMNKVFFISIILILATACGKSYTPKPYGYFRIYTPPHDYNSLQEAMPFKFDYSKSATINLREQAHETYWFDLKYPQFNAAVHVSYKAINGNFRSLTEDARRFVYKHSVKADNISESAFSNDSKKVYGLLYDLKGNTASNLQFVITDSTRHFIRGALYFDNVPNKDSIAPVTAYIRQDIIQLIESFDWK